MKNIQCLNANNTPYLDYVLKLILTEWNNGDFSKIEEKKKRAKENNTNTYVMLDNNKPVGCFVICNNDIKGYPEYSPCLACVCVDKKYRNNGYGLDILAESIKKFKELNIKTAYLKTTLTNFYERVGWKQFATVKIDNKIEKLYKLKIQ